MANDVVFGLTYGEFSDCIYSLYLIHVSYFFPPYGPLISLLCSSSSLLCQTAELIQALQELENAASSDSVLRQRISSLPAEVQDTSLLHRITGRRQETAHCCVLYIYTHKSVHSPLTLVLNCYSISCLYRNRGRVTSELI